MLPPLESHLVKLIQQVHKHLAASFLGLLSDL